MLNSFTNNYNINPSPKLESDQKKACIQPLANLRKLRSKRLLLKKTDKNPNFNFHDGNEDMNAKDDTIDKCSSDDTKHVNDHKSAHHVTTQDTDVKAKDDSPDVNANIVRKPEKVKSGECFFCGEQTLNTCKFCDNIFFCSQEHFLIHRPANYCHPFIVKTDPSVGRYTIASRDIQPCEIILRERPAVTGPYTKCTPVCLQCYKQTSGSYLCPVCGCPVCNYQCSQGNIHQLECQFAAERNIKFAIKSFDRPNSFYCNITVLRMLLTKSNDPESYRRIINLMDHHQERQSEGTYSMTAMKMTVTAFLTKTFGPDIFSEAEVERNIGILRTNGMKLDQGGLRDNPGVVLYPVYCLINHACYNNTNYVKHADHSLSLRAQVAIKTGEEITTRYVSATLGNCRRRRDLSRYWYFSCQCVRCSDSTELGTHLSSTRCKACRDGLCVKREPLDCHSDWVCQVCGNTELGDTIVQKVDRIEEEISEVNKDDTEKLEELIAKYSNHDLLHPQHYLVIELMHSLAITYSSMARLTRPQQERKVQLCHQVLKVLGVVDPGFTTWRGKLLHEMASTLLLISRADYGDGRIREILFKKRLFFCMRTLATAKKCQVNTNDT